MPKIHQTRDVAYRPDEMYALVADIERYPEFLPWCVGLRIRKREQTDTCEILTADMIVAYALLREKFTSRVTLDQSQNRIDVTYVEGPFRNLTTKWFFEPLDKGGCRIHFDLEFEFRSLALQALITAVFGKAFNRMMQAFIDRADVLYARNALGG